MGSDSEKQVIKCKSCGAANRVNVAVLRQKANSVSAVCGKCKQPLPTVVDHPVTVSDSNFADVVTHATLPVLVDFWAPWCGPCRMIAPAIESLASQFAGRVLVGKLNVDENPISAARYQVSSIPTLIIFKDGVEQERIQGAQPPQLITQCLSAYL